MGQEGVFLLVGDWPGRVGGRQGTRGGTSLLADSSREARLCGDSLERENQSKQPQASPSQLESIESLLLVACNAMAYR